MVQEIQTRRSDGTLAIRHGLLPGVVVEPLQGRQDVSGRFYLLDMDYYDVRSEALDMERTTKQLRDYNDVLYDFFRWSLSETLYTYLKPEAEHA